MSTGLTTTSHRPISPTEMLGLLHAPDVLRTAAGRIGRPAQEPLARVQLLFLGLAAASGAADVVAVLASGRLLAGACVGVAVLVLVAHWARRHRHGNAPIAMEPVELGLVLVLVYLSQNDPFILVFGLVFHALHDGLPATVMRYGLWMLALLGLHADRGPEHVADDIAKVVVLALIPLVVPAFRLALQRSQASERRLRSLVQNSTDVTTVVGPDLVVRWQAESIRGVFGHEPSGIVGTPILDLVHPADRQGIERWFTDATGHHGVTRTLAFRLRDGRGEFRHVEAVASNRLHDPSVGGYVLNVRDATERMRLEHELREVAAEREHDALHDPLTGLANRRKLFAGAGEAIARAGPQGDKLALLLLDLDQFKELNDTLGHHIGDRVLCEIRTRLTSSLPEAEVVARLGGDEFAVLLAPGVSRDEAERVGARLCETLGRPLPIEDMTLPIRASLGIAMFPEHGGDIDSLLQRADVAMYSAKASGAGHEIYSPANDGHSRARLALAGQLPEALADGQFRVHFQPKFDLRSGAMTGAEALVRWQHPELGLLGPDAFIPLVEQTGLMRKLTLRVLDEALGACASWDAAGVELEIAVNLSAPDLLDLGLAGNVIRLLERWDMPAERLQLEVTETIIGADPVRVGEVLQGLCRLGVTLALDDFGTGSSSLGYLRRLPVHVLKIDKSFVIGLATSDQDATIVRATVDLAHGLGMRIVAEGIEDEISVRRLVSFGCDLGQGFHLGGPVPAAELLARALKTRDAIPAALLPAVA